jgi:glutamate racemase
MLGPGITLYDPSRPVARRVRQVLLERDQLASNPNPTFEFYTTGDADTVRRVASRLLRIPVARVDHVDI